MKLEVHIHTKYSKDSLLSLFLLYMKCVMFRIDWVAITEHNNIDGALNFKKFCEKHGKKVNVIVGEEILTTKGEIIGLYLTENIPPLLSPTETIDRVKKQGGVVYVPHPYDEKRYKTVLSEEDIKLNKDRIDCIEIYNGRNVSHEYAIKQREIAEKYDLPFVVGSDAHTWIEIGRIYMLCPEMDLSTAENFKKLLTEVKFETKPCIKISHQITKVAKLFKLLVRGNINELCRIIFKKLERYVHKGSQ